jgi:hypothetical protein
MSNRHNSIGARTLFPLALVLVIAGAAPAAAQTEPTAMQKIFGAMGLLELPKDPIVYRERAPLVVPPAVGLVPPRSPGDMSQYNPDWPVDHDRRQVEAIDPEVERKADYDFYTGRALLPGELSGGRISRGEAARRAATKGAPQSVEESQQVLSPTQLGFKGWGVKTQEEKVVFTGEPERHSLTQPPPGLRTPSQDAPYGMVSSRPAGAKPATLYERVDGSLGR